MIMTDRKFTTDEIKALAECERMMDGGHPYVVLDGHRIMVTPEAMEELGLEHGQTITLPIQIAILEFNIAHCTTQIALDKAKAAASADKDPA